MQVTCDGCGHSFDQRSVYQMITAWVPTTNRSRLVGRRYEQRFACKPCVEAFTRTGQSWQQLSLLD